MSLKILITGATGYLAGPLALYLSKKLNDHKIILGARDIEKLSKIEELHNFEKRYFDIGLSESFEDSIKDIDVIIHLAGMGARSCAENPVLAEFINTTQVESLIKTALKQNVKQFIYFSTVHVYGTPLVGELSEKTVPNPQSVYAKTHYQAEEIVLKYLKEKKISGAILRLSNVIAPPLILDGESSQLVAVSACRQAIFEKKIVLNSSGEDFRDFVSLYTLGDFVMKLLEQNCQKDDNLIFNIGSGKTLRIIDLMNLIQAQCSSLYEFKPSIQTGVQVRNVSHFNLDVSLATNTLNSLCHGIEEAIKDTLSSTKRKLLI